MRYRTDKVLLPLMIQQNYIKYVGNNITFLKEISDKLSKGDMIENMIYNNQNWELEEIHGINTCVIPAFYMGKDKHYNMRLDFPCDLNKTSTKKTNKKNIKITRFNISDFIVLNEMIEELSKKYKKSEMLNIINEYNISGSIDVIQRLNINGRKKKK